MKILVSGASGLIGSAVVAELALGGHDVYTLGRNNSKDPKALNWDIEARTGSLKSIDGLQGVVHLSGESIGNKRWTYQQKKKIVASRLEGTQFLIDLLADADLKPEVLVAASAIGIYGSRNDETLDESSEAGNGFLASLVLDWEQEARRAQSIATRVVFARTGVVLSTYGGMLAKQLTLFKYGLGAVLGSGKQYLSWIHLEDEVRAIVASLTNPSISGAVNLVSPNPVTNLDFSKTLARVLHRPLLFKVPAVALELALGKEFADEMLFASQRVAPTVLQKAGFEFKFPDLENALSDLLR
ncbi:MAG: TIGR01777 family oxidoreductase [Actinomycetota bacterium]|jgi:hypothetical protein|nr:TIGR01777 family oxidoreductase [Actinomycetota bacterium]